MATLPFAFKGGFWLIFLLGDTKYRHSFAFLSFRPTEKSEKSRLDGLQSPANLVPDNSAICAGVKYIVWAHEKT